MKTIKIENGVPVLVDDYNAMHPNMVYTERGNDYVTVFLTGDYYGPEDDLSIRKGDEAWDIQASVRFENGKDPELRLTYPDVFDKEREDLIYETTEDEESAFVEVLKRTGLKIDENGELIKENFEAEYGKPCYEVTQGIGSHFHARSMFGRGGEASLTMFETREEAEEMAERINDLLRERFKL